MIRNKLHTVNKWNKPAFMQERNLFAIGGLGTMNAIEGRVQSNLGSSPSINLRPFSQGKLNSGVTANKGINPYIMAANTAAPTVGSLIGGGYHSGVGDTIGTVGGTVGSLVGTVNPALGLAINVGSQVIGGAVNGLFGEKADEKALAQANAGTNYLGNFISDAGSYEDLDGIQDQAMVDDPYSGGIFNSSAKRKNAKLKRERENALSWAERSVENNIDNIWNDQMNNYLANYSSKGGRLHAGGGSLETSFLDDFSTDPIGAAVRYNRGLEEQEAAREAAEAEAAREAEYSALQDRMARLETQNQGLQSLLAATSNNNAIIVPETTSSPTHVTPPEATSDYGSLSDFIRSHEGFRSNAYWLSGEDAPTIGYGFHTVYPGTNKRVQIGDRITREEADRYLDTAIAGIGSELSKKVPNWDKMKPYQRDALIDLAYGTGTGGKHFRKNSKLMTALRNENWEEAERQLVSRSASLPEYNKYLLEISKRRQDMFRNGNYSMKAFGGELGTNGTDWRNGLLYVDEGDSHERNPLGGVPMGLDENGTPNLVEEGETVFNDYVFSNRLKVPSSMSRELGLGGSINKKGITFAEASKKLAKESENRPNDPISLSGLEASLSRLAEVQEAERAKQNMQEYVGLSALGGRINRHPDGGYLWDDFFKVTNPTSKRRGNSPNTYMIDTSYTGNVGDWEKRPEYQAFTDYMLNKATDDERRNYFKWITENTGGGSGHYLNPDGTLVSDWRNKFTHARNDGKWGIQHYTPPMAPATPASTGNIYHAVEGDEDYLPGDPSTWNGVGPELRRVTLDNGDTVIYHDRAEKSPTSTEEQLKTPEDGTVTSDPHIYPTWMRYAPVWGAGTMSLTDTLGLTNRPDYGAADMLEATARRAGYAPNVKAKPIGNYMTYRPMDIWYEQNRLNANTRATDRAIANNASPTGTRMAGLLASEYNNQIGSGNLYRQALEYNDAQRKAVADFNRRTDMFNSQMGLEAAMANARYRQAAAQLGLSGLGQAAALRDSIDARIGASRSANLTNFLTSLGNIGRENFALNQINTDRSRRYTTDNRGVSGYKRSASLGGKIKKQK